MSFQQGLSGLNASSKNLEVIGNNVANANTVGFKSSRAEFSNLYANANSAAAVQIGIGTSVQAVTQQFDQGNLSVTSNPLDVAINGQGLFRVQTNGSVAYTRNGQFQQDKDGYIVTNSGARLTGYPVDSLGNISTGVIKDLQINTADLPPNVSTKVFATMNLDARKPTLTTTFDPTNAATYHNATSISVYDSLGKENALSLYFVRRNLTGAEPAGTVSTWEIYGSFNGNMLNPGPPPTSFGSLNFDGAGAMVGSAVLTMPDLVPSNGANTITGLPLDMSGSSQFASTFGVSKLSQDGFGPGRVTGLSISPDGVVLSRYSNGQSRASGQVVLASFANLQGLANIGANSWVETPQSGQPTVGVPKSSNLGALQSGSLEDANVDITAELVNMITAQRVYQANAQTIKTQDQVLQTLVNLR